MFNCTCIDLDERPEFLSERVVTARKEHTCCECGSTIQPGSRYECASGKWDGQCSTFKTCMVCRTIRHDFMQCGWHYGTLFEDIRYANDYDDDDDDDDWLM